MPGALQFFGSPFVAVDIPKYSGHPAEFLSIKTTSDGEASYTKIFSKRSDILFYSGNCALFNDGTVTCWLNDDDKLLILPTPKVSSRFVQVASGWRHFIALCEDGHVLCWWAEDAKQQTKIPADLKDVVAVTASREASHALTKNGDVISWGVEKETSHPKTLKSIIQIQGTVGLTSAGQVVPWGLDDLGDICFPVPSKMPKIKNLTCGVGGFDESSAPVAITEEGRLKGFGHHWEQLDQNFKEIKKKVKKVSINMSGFDAQGAFVLFEDNTAKYYHFFSEREEDNLSENNPEDYFDAKKFKNIIDLGVFGPGALGLKSGRGLWVLFDS